MHHGKALEDNENKPDQHDIGSIMEGLEEAMNDG